MSDRPDEVVATAGADYSPILQPGESLGPLKDFELLALMSIELGRTPHAAAYESVQSAFVSPTALSKSLQRLENAVGVRLLNRTTKAVQLTAEGALLLDQIAPAMIAIGQALDSLNDPEKDVQGTLRITVPTVAYSLLLERHIADFLHRYPLQLEMLIEDALVDIVSVLTLVFVWASDLR